MDLALIWPAWEQGLAALCRVNAVGGVGIQEWYTCNYTHIGYEILYRGHV